MKTFLDFEQPIADLEGKIEELRHLSNDDDINITEEVRRLKDKVQKLLSNTYDNLSPWQKVQVARHPERPHCIDYITNLIKDFIPLAGDRQFGEDKSIRGGLGVFRNHRCLVLGHEKGANTSERVEYNFGMPRPEGYRKAARLMRLASHFQLPVISLVDTPGAYPGIGAEERGQAEAIASCIEACLTVNVPFISVIIGEGGSGGAVAIAAGDRVLMLEHSIYSVISPEGCASILWRDAGAAETAAEALCLTAKELKAQGLIDTIVDEPLGGAHRDKNSTINAVGDAIETALKNLETVDRTKICAQRRAKYLRLGEGGME